jgi:hypothetical protein
MPLEEQLRIGESGKSSTRGAEEAYIAKMGRKPDGLGGPDEEEVAIVAESVGALGPDALDFGLLGAEELSKLTGRGDLGTGLEGEAIGAKDGDTEGREAVWVAGAAYAKLCGIAVGAPDLPEVEVEDCGGLFEGVDGLEVDRDDRAAQVVGEFRAEGNLVGGLKVLVGVGGEVKPERDFGDEVVALFNPVAGGFLGSEEVGGAKDTLETLS